MKYNNTHKLIVVKNGRTLNYVFSYRTEEEKLEKLKQWKAENISPYDKVTLLFNGSLEEHEELIRPCFSKENICNIENID